MILRTYRNKDDKTLNHKVFMNYYLATQLYNTKHNRFKRTTFEEKDKYTTKHNVFKRFSKKMASTGSTQTLINGKDGFQPHETSFERAI